MSDALLIYNGVTVGGDYNNTASNYVKRGADKSVNVAQLNATIASVTALLGAPNTYTTTVTLDTTSVLVLLDATSGSFTATLPPAAASTGQIYLLTKIDSSGNLPTIKGNASEVIVTHGVPSGANTYTGLSTQGYMMILACDGTKWHGGQLAA